jgi:hypothetical protein
MSQLSIPLQIRCSHCHDPMVIEQLETTESDPDSVKLHAMMGMLEKTALCKRCQERRKYYAEQGRGDEWERGAV